MKLSVYARQIGVTYKTAYRWWKAGRLDAYQSDTGTVIVRDPLPKSATGVALYARVSSVDQKNDLERQMERLKDYAAAHGYHVMRMVQETGSHSREKHDISARYERWCHRVLSRRYSQASRHRRGCDRFLARQCR